MLQSPHNLSVYGSPSLELPGLTLQSTDAARNLGCYFDRHMQLDRLISSYCSSAYYHLRLIAIIRHPLMRHACHAAVRSIVLSRLDVRNALFGGLNNGQFNRLQRVQNSAARLTNQHIQDCAWQLALDYLKCAAVCYTPTLVLRYQHTPQTDNVKENDQTEQFCGYRPTNVE